MGTIALDNTFYIQLVNFIITLVVLNFILIKPVREQISARKALTDGYLDDIDNFTTQANEKLSAYEAELDTARVNAGEIRDELREQGHGEEQNIIKFAQTEASAFLKTSREDTAQKVKATTDDLMKKTPDFAKQVVSRILN